MYLQDTPDAVPANEARIVDTDMGNRAGMDTSDTVAETVCIADRTSLEVMDDVGNQEAVWWVGAASDGRRTEEVEDDIHSSGLVSDANKDNGPKGEAPDAAGAAGAVGIRSQFRQALVGLVLGSPVPALALPSRLLRR